LIAGPDHHGKARKPVYPVSIKKDIGVEECLLRDGKGRGTATIFGRGKPPGRGAAANTVLAMQPYKLEAFSGAGRSRT
jgi:hypothetical protein